MPPPASELLAALLPPGTDADILEYLSGTLPDLDTYLANNDEFFSSLFAANISGRPAVSGPMGRVGQAPAGAQLLGRRGDDQLLLDLATVIEEAGIGTQPLDLAR